MPSSRYRNLNAVDGKYYETSEFPSKKELDKIQCINIRPTAEDRLDSLSFKYLGAGEYWWIIALMNDLTWAFDFEPGKILRIPVDVNDVLKLI